LKPALQPVYTSKQLAQRVTALGRTISGDYGKRTLDIVVMLDSAFVFAADHQANFLPGGLPFRVGGDPGRAVWRARSTGDLLQPATTPGEKGCAGDRCGGAVGPDTGLSLEAATGEPAAFIEVSGTF
jgi:hypothetical protein